MLITMKKGPRRAPLCCGRLLLCSAPLSQRAGPPAGRGGPSAQPFLETEMEYKPSKNTETKIILLRGALDPGPGVC